MKEWLQDLRYGTRMLVKRPGTSAIAVVALALGIGLTTTMFSIVQGVLLRGLPFDRSDRIISLSRATVANPDRRQGVPTHDIVDWRDRQTSFEQLAAYSGSAPTMSGDDGWPERLRGARITPNTLALLRVAPVVGRDFTEADARPGAPAVALIGHQLWASRFKADPAVAGRVVRLNGVATTIVGVLPPKFGFPESHEIWTPQPIAPPVTRGDGPTLTVIGRLKDGVTLAQATAEITGIARQLAEVHVENKDTLARVAPFIDDFVPTRIRTTFYTMMGAVLGVMLIACVNVTNLQLARAADRAKEVAIRAALGSGRWRIVRQSLAEGLVLSAIGAVIGLGIAQFGVTTFMRAIADTRPPFWIDVRLDPTVLAFVTAITVAAALVSSVAPGLRVARTDANAVLKDDTRGATSLRMGRFGRWLVVVEVTVSCVLLIVSGLMIRSILATSRIDYPFATRDVFYAQLQIDERAHRENADVGRVTEQLQERLARLPGVRGVSLSTGVPGGGGSSSFSVEGETYATPDARPAAIRISATPGFFDVLRVPLKEGRFFDARDAFGALPIAVVDEAFAAKHLPGGPAIGRRIRFGDDKAPWLTVVGVVPTLATPAQPGQPVEAAYTPLAQAPQRFMTVLARADGDPAALTSAVRGAVAELSDQSPVSSPNSLAGEFWRRGWAFRVFGGLFLTFGAAALVLAAAGLYGVMSFTVRRRTQEIGVRMALGASRRGVLRMVLWQGFWRVALGVAIGIWPGWLVGGQMQALLANVTPSDPVVHGVTVVTLLAAGLLACLAPALRAASVDPLTALRHD